MLMSILSFSRPGLQVQSIHSDQSILWARRLWCPLYPLCTCLERLFHEDEEEAKDGSPHSGGVGATISSQIPPSSGQALTCQTLRPAPSPIWEKQGKRRVSKSASHRTFKRPNTTLRIPYRRCTCMSVEIPKVGNFITLACDLFPIRCQPYEKFVRLVLALGLPRTKTAKVAPAGFRASDQFLSCTTRGDLAAQRRRRHAVWMQLLQDLPVPLLRSLGFQG